MSLPLPIFLVVFSTFSLHGHAAINKWVDENNRVHYSDQPAPSNAKAAPLRTPSETDPVAAIAPAASEVTAPKTLAEREAEFRKAQKAKEEQEKKEAKQKEEDQVRQRYCEDARSNQLTLENSRRIATYDSKGELVYMDEATRNQRMEEVRKAISKHCQ